MIKFKKIKYMTIGKTKIKRKTAGIHLFLIRHIC